MNSKKAKFLESIKGNKLKYKRVNMTPIRYAGGKSLAVGFICELIPEDVKRVVSLFFGGGSVEFAIANGLKIPVIGYDIFPDLVNFFQILKNEKNKLIEELEKLEPTRDIYDQIKEELRLNWTKKISLDKLAWARDFYFNHNLSYGPSFLGWMSKIYENKNKYISALEKLKKTNMTNIDLFNASFEEVIDQHKNDFLYLDPPYFIGGSSKMFAGIYPQRNFPIYHKNFDHSLLAQKLQNHHGGFILSYNDCEEIRNFYQDCEIQEIQWQYTMGQGETRIGKNRQESGINHVKASHELLIYKKPMI